LKESVLFLPSNRNHVLQFYPLYEILKKKYRVLFITQGSYKNEGAEEKLRELKVSFKKFENYDIQNPKFIIKTEGVKTVVIGNDVDIIPQWFVNTANKIGIFSVLIQDGLLFDIKKSNRSISSGILKLFNKQSNKLLLLELMLIASGKYKRLNYGLFVLFTLFTVFQNLLAVFSKSSSCYACFITISASSKSLFAMISLP